MNQSTQEVDRPSFHIWQPLEAEGILWEGQVLIVGAAADMPARLAVTSQRLALIANGQIMLDFPRQWLRPAPRLAAENGVRIFINPDGGNGEASPVLLRARDGRGAAMELVAVLTGRPLTMTKAAGGVLIPNWKDTVGASRSVALPQLSEEPEAAPRLRTQSFWPPQETDGVAARPVEPEQSNLQPRKQATNRPMQQLADQRRAIPDPRPVPSSISRAARNQATHEDGVTVRDDTGWQDGHFRAQTTRRRGVGAWLVSAAIAIMLIGGIGFVVQDKYDLTLDDLRERIPANVQESLGIAPADDQDLALNNAPETVDSPQERDSDGTDGSDDANGGVTEPEETDVAVVEPTEEATDEAAIEEDRPSSDVDGEPLDPTTGLGGPTTALPETTEPAEVQQDPTEPVETVAPTDEPVVEPTVEVIEPTEEPVVEPTAEPTEEPAPTEEPVATEEPTVEPTNAPTEEPVVEPTIEPTAEATEEPVATEEPAPTEEATTEPTAMPTEEVDETPTIEPQEPSVLPETTPEQAVVSDGFRYTIESASVGETVPELPEINSVAGYGQWVVLNVHSQNMSGDVQVFDMSDFVLYADGQEVELDSGTGWVNGLVGNTPAYGATDAIQWASGESHMVTLTFLAPANATSLVLQAGDQTLDLSPAFENAAPLSSEGPRVESDLIEGTVVEVIDGETIVVEIDGIQQTVRYLGLDVPTVEACYAAEAADANRSLVERQTVTIERQATDKDARGNWVRDVWVTDDAGLPVLVSQQLIAQGAAEANISAPNTRFAGWLQQTQSAAQEEGAGLWDACGE